MIARTILILVTVLLLGCNTKSQTQTQKIDKLINLATTADSLFDLKSSVRYYSEILEIDSTKLIALINRGRAYLWLGDQEKGFQDYDKAVRLYPHEHTYSSRGMAYVSVSRYEKATVDLLKAIGMNRELGEPYYGLSIIQLNQDRIEEAQFLCEKADKNAYDEELSRKIWLTIYQKKGDYVGMENQITELLKKNQKDPIQFNNRGYAKLQQKKYEEAVKDFDTAIRLDSNTMLAYANKGTALIQMKKLEAAAECLNSALTRKANDAKSLTVRAEVYFAKRERARGCADLALAKENTTDVELIDKINKLVLMNCKKKK